VNADGAIMQIDYPPRVELARRPTPLQLMSRASQQWGMGHRLWIKRDDLTGSTLSGNKVRKLEFVVAHAIEQGCDTLITCGGIQSNHCRATALAGAQLGLNVHLILRGNEPHSKEGNFLLDHLAGAQISCYPPRQFARDLDSLFCHWQEHYAAAGQTAFAVPTGASDGLGIWGYIAACEELQDDFREHQIDRAHIVTATGSGGTQAGLTVGVQLHDLPATVWGVCVCDNEQYFLDKVAQDARDWQRRFPEMPVVVPDIRVIDGHVGAGYGLASEEVFTTIAERARLEGLVLDPVYTGKAFNGMISEIAAGRFDDCTDIVFVHTGGIYGLFPQQHHFDQ